MFLHRGISYNNFTWLNVTIVRYYHDSIARVCTGRLYTEGVMRTGGNEGRGRLNSFFSDKNQGIAVGIRGSMSDKNC